MCTENRYVPFGTYQWYVHQVPMVPWYTCTNIPLVTLSQKYVHVRIELIDMGPLEKFTTAIAVSRAINSAHSLSQAVVVIAN